MSTQIKRMTPAFLFLFLAAFLPFANSSSAEDQIFYAESPSWVEAIDFPEVEDWDFRDGKSTLLSDIQIHRPEGIRFERSAKYLNNPLFEDRSEVEINFCPSFEKLIIHKISLHRNGVEIDQLPTCRRRIFKCKDSPIQSTDLHQALFFLDDFRKGDILEYAYSIEGKYPQVGDSRYGRLFFSPNSYSEKFFTRLITEKDSFLQMKPFQGAPAPTIQVFDEDFLEWRWEQEKVVSFEVEPTLPTWYLPALWIQFSSYASWNEVAAEHASFYQQPEEYDPKLLALVSEWQQEFPSIKRQITEAIRYVQSSIRYLSFHDERDGFIPHSPNDVFNRRYGNCIDKSHFLVTLCHLLGVQAYPVYVGTKTGKNAIHHLPEYIGSFNHAICCIEYEEKRYFIEPGAYFQGGTLETFCVPPYYYGLILDEEVGDLVEIPIEKSKGRKSREWLYQLNDSSKAAELSFQLTFSGSHADRFRRNIREGYQEDIESHIQRLLSKHCEKLKSVEEPSIVDDFEENQINLSAKYDVQGLHKTDDQVELCPIAFSGFIDPEFSTKRKAPLAIPFPFDVEDSITVEASAKSSIEIEEKSISYCDEYISYEIEWEMVDSDKFKVYAHYQTLQDAVMPEDLESFKTGLNVFYENSSIQFTVLEKSE